MKNQLRKLVNGDTWLAEEYKRIPVSVVDRYFEAVDLARVFLVVLRKAAIAGYTLTIDDVNSVVATFDKIDALGESMGVVFKPQTKTPLMKDRFNRRISELFDIALAQGGATPLVKIGSVPRKEKVGLSD